MRRWFVLMSAAGVLVSAGQVAAAGKPTAAQRAAVLQAVVDCRRITDTTARLACFDAAAAKLDEAEASGQVVVIDKEQARQVRREVFGLQLPSLDLFARAPASGAAAQSEAVDRIAATVKTAARQADGRWMFELDTGAVWTQLLPEELAIDPHVGSKVEIRQGALGSFLMKVDGQPAFKAHRER